MRISRLFKVNNNENNDDEFTGRRGKENETQENESRIVLFTKIIREGAQEMRYDKTFYPKEETIASNLEGRTMIRKD